MILLHILPSKRELENTDFSTLEIKGPEKRQLLKSNLPILSAE